MNSLGWHPSLKLSEKEHSSSRVYVFKRRIRVRRRCVLTAKICTVLLTKSFFFLTFHASCHCRLRCYKLPIILVVQGNSMGIECSGKKTISFYINKCGVTTPAVSLTHFRIALSLFIKAGTNLSHESEFNL